MAQWATVAKIWAVGALKRAKKSVEKTLHSAFGVKKKMEGSSGKGYAWAISAGFNAACAAVSAKLLFPPVIRYGLVVIFNVMMWGCYVNSLKDLSSLQATVTNFATNFLTSGLAGFFLFDELLSIKWFAGAMFIVIGVLILSKSSIEMREKTD